ncbi:autotransporter outer membrane beta-barrel domain-containing protein [Candidatus Synechococcus spongiarum]|uniref:autotransporter outer membrane beta-barrel domain-containing protein n=1 Tax=Candidatus Synechococcus spongiarum TaxID=431041 RepID=UPI000472724C|nr:autotransporter outer membrane beta-barrel domain-containing protein [Candidatus Synechococcus spongiarum]
MAQTYADKGWTRWEPVATALTALEALEAAAQPSVQPSVEPTVSISGGSSVTEGGEVVFTLTASPAPASDIQVGVSVTERGSFASAGATGARTVTIGTGGTVDFTVATEDDDVDEADGAIAATVTAGTGYTVGSVATASVTVADDDISTKSMLSVSDASGEEGEALEFTISLSRPYPDTGKGGMVVLVRTRESSPVSARQGQDFRIRSDGNYVSDGQTYAVISFRPGDTENTVLVSTLDDAHDDDGETFELYIDRIYFADDVEIADGVGIGTIRNSDPMPAAWLGRFGRTVSQQVVDGVKGRFKAAPAVGLDLTVAGQHLSSVPLEENEGALRKLLGFESVSGEQLVADSSFSFSPQTAAAAGAGTGGTGGAGLAFWGQGAITSFSAREDAISLDGDVSTALLGAEWSTERWLAGAALSHSWGSGGYEGEGDDGDDGSISTTLLGLFPYGRYALTSRLGVWAIGGYGWGDLTLKQRNGGEELNTTTNLAMGAVGLEGVLLDGGSDGLTLTTTADALLVETTSEGIVGLKSSEASISRLRLGLEATRPVHLANDGALLPAMEIGIRQDGGDAETGFGLELGAGLSWTAPQRGISAALQGRTLLTHTEEEFREQGLAVSFAWDPSPSDRGPSLSMGHTMGASASGGMDALLNPVVLEGLAALGTSGQHFEAQLAYGLPFHNNRLTLSPGVTVAFSLESRSYGLLWSLAAYSQQGQTEPWEISLEGERQEYRSSSPTRHSLKLDFSLLF